jgi:ring-1,2-phenylacetyl-CoA epoxidase subunit PaaC
MSNEIKEALFEYCLRMGDNALILGHRISEWCGHGPVLEQDIALTNIALDHVGHSRSMLTYAGEVEGKGRTEDDLAYHRLEHEFRNILLVEQPNGDFGQTIARSFFYDHFNYLFMSELKKSKDETLAAVAEKSLKEVTYHRQFSSEWILRLGDGTEESHNRIQASINLLWIYTEEFFKTDKVDATLVEAGLVPDAAKLRDEWQQNISEIIAKATLTLPTEMPWSNHQGKNGVHTEHMGFILTELQYLPRAYPGAKW